MCFVLVLLGVHPRHPLVVAANRDEVRSRPSSPPHQWQEEPPLWAGRDESGGGTWLGVNAHGMLVAITNRRGGEVDPSLRSRGLLCLDTLREPGTDAALRHVRRELASRPYNPFNLLCVTPEAGWVITWRGDVFHLSQGLHVATTHGDLDDPGDPKLVRARELADLPALADAALPELLAGSGAICADAREPDSICRAGGDRGTVSSSIIALGRDHRVAAYWHAEGPPSEHPYHPVLPRAASRGDLSRRVSAC